MAPINFIGAPINFIGFKDPLHTYNNTKNGDISIKK